MEVWYVLNSNKNQQVPALRFQSKETGDKKEKETLCTSRGEAKRKHNEWK